MGFKRNCITCCDAFYILVRFVKTLNNIRKAGQETPAG